MTTTTITTTTLTIYKIYIKHYEICNHLQLFIFVIIVVVIGHFSLVFVVVKIMAMLQMGAAPVQFD